MEAETAERLLVHLRAALRELDEAGKIAAVQLDGETSREVRRPIGKMMLVLHAELIERILDTHPHLAIPDDCYQQ